MNFKLWEIVKFLLYSNCGLTNNKMKDLIKQGVDLAEKEIQEKQINEIKRIVKDYLEEIESVKKDKEKLDKKLLTLKKDLDDIKSGRLDKIEERHKVDPECKKISLIQLVPIQLFPTTPWKSIYEIQLLNHWDGGYGTVTLGNNCNTVYTTTGTNTLTSYSDTTVTLTNSSNLIGISGTNFQNFASGSYDINGKIIFL